MVSDKSSQVARPNLHVTYMCVINLLDRLFETKWMKDQEDTAYLQTWAYLQAQKCLWWQIAQASQLPGR